MRLFRSAFALSAVFALGLVISPDPAWSKECPEEGACACGDLVGDDYNLNHDINCTCGATNCLRLDENADLSGTGTLRCPTGATTCTERAIEMRRGNNTVTGINIVGNGVDDEGGGANFANGIYLTDAKTAWATNVDITGVGNYGYQVESNSTMTISGGTVTDAKDEGIHVRDAKVTLNNYLAFSDIGGEAIYVFSRGVTDVATNVTINNVTVDGFSLNGGDAESGMYVKRAGSCLENTATECNANGPGCTCRFGKGATVTATNLVVAGTGPTCIDALDDTASTSNESQVTINNRALRNGTTPVSGLACTKWLKANGGTKIAYSDDTAALCCCKLNGVLADITLHLYGAGGEDDACSSGPECGGCC